MEIMTEYLVLFFLFDCFYLSAMTFDFLLVKRDDYDVNLELNYIKEFNKEKKITVPKSKPNLELKTIIVQILH